MRILVVAGVFPYPPTNGYRMRTWALLQSLVASGCSVELLTFGAPDELREGEEQVRSICGTLEVVPHALTSLSAGPDYLRRLRALPSPLPFAVGRFRSATMEARLLDRLKSHPPDAILCDTPYPLVNFPATLGAPLILNQHNVEHILLERYVACERNPARRAYAWLEWWKLRRWEQRACARADLVLACSETDRAAMVRLCATAPVAVVPNVVDVERYRPVPSGDASTVLFTGGMDWYPNRDAVEFFVSQILPELRALAPGVKFVVAGRSPSEEFRRKVAALGAVEFTGTVPDMAEPLERAAVCVVPLRIGSGTRLKILEAAAMARPIVSTRVGAEGLNFMDKEEILLADEPRAFAQAVAALLADARERRYLGEAARRRVERQYSFPVLQAAVRRVVAELAELSAGPNTPPGWVRSGGASAPPDGAPLTFPPEHEGMPQEGQRE